MIDSDFFEGFLSYTSEITLYPSEGAYKDLEGRNTFISKTESGIIIFGIYVILLKGKSVKDDQLGAMK